MERSGLPDEFFRRTGYHRKHATARLNRPAEGSGQLPRRRCGPSYSPTALRVARAVWKAAGHPWSARLKALLPPQVMRTVHSYLEQRRRDPEQVKRCLHEEPVR